MINDRRKFDRLHTDLSIYLKEINLPEEQTSLLKTKISNISEGGVYIKQPRYKVFSVLDIVIPVKNSKEYVYAIGIVQYNDGKGIGVKFIKINNDSLDKLKELIFV